MITGLYGAEAEIRRYKLTNDIHFEPKTLISPELFFVFSSHTDCRVYKAKLAEELKKIKADKDSYHRTLVQYIDQWGIRFKDKPSLVQEIRQEHLKASLPSDFSDVSDKSDLLEQENEKSDTSDVRDTPDLNHSTTQAKPSDEKTSHQQDAIPNASVKSETETKPNVPLSPAAQRALQF